MKTLWIILLILLFAFMTFGYSQEVYYGRQITLTWDTVITTVSGVPIEPDETITYTVYLQHRDTLEIIAIQEISGNALTFSYSKGVYVAGVSATIEYPDGTKIENPDVTWSTMTDTERVPVPFYTAFYEVAGVVTGLEVVP